MRGKAAAYRDTLRALVDWDSFLREHSGLPGPRANIELGQAVADVGDETLFRRCLADNDPSTAPTNSAHEFLAFCGMLGLGRLLAEGRSDLLPLIREYAGDPRWRLREAVAMALQRWGLADRGAMLSAIQDWTDGTLLERRAVVAASCEPALLDDRVFAAEALSILDGITTSVAHMPDRESDDFKALYKALAYGWSVAVVGLPERGKPLMEKWLAVGDPVVQRIMRENLGKARLERMDADWVAACRARLG